MTALLEISGLRKLFPVAGRRLLHAVDDVDLVLHEGESLGIVGESGSGKSTLARLVARLIDPTSGTIRFDGRDIAAVPARTFATDLARRDIQLVFQSAGDSLNPAFSAGRNIAVGLGAQGLRTDRRRLVEQISREIGLGPELLDRRPHQLSGGQQARVGLARALVSEPRLVILDEPTAPLDVSVQANVLKLIDGLRRTRRLSMLFVSHDLEVVRLMCDRVLVLYLGRVAEIGPVDEVLRAPCHPYTRTLIDAMPGRGRMAAWPGEPTSPIDPPAEACLYAGRCAFAEPRCSTKGPRMHALTHDHAAACHLL